jgi:hypothetical protein
MLSACYFLDRHCVLGSLVTPRCDRSKQCFHNQFYLYLSAAHNNIVFFLRFSASRLHGDLPRRARPQAACSLPFRDPGNQCSFMERVKILAMEPESVEKNRCPSQLLQRRPPFDNQNKGRVEHYESWHCGSESESLRGLV